jgi:hypothetical protein
MNECKHIYQVFIGFWYDYPRIATAVFHLFVLTDSIYPATVNIVLWLGLAIAVGLIVCVEILLTVDVAMSVFVRLCK